MQQLGGYFHYLHACFINTKYPKISATLILDFFAAAFPSPAGELEVHTLASKGGCDCTDSGSFLSVFNPPKKPVSPFRPWPDHWGNSRRCLTSTQCCKQICPFIEETVVGLHSCLIVLCAIFWKIAAMEAAWMDVVYKENIEISHIYSKNVVVCHSYWMGRYWLMFY